MLGFGLLYGNALSRQQEWTSLRQELLVEDLNQTEGIEQVETVVVKGSIGLAPSLAADCRDYPILTRLIRSTLGGDRVWAVYSLANYTGLSAKGVQVVSTETTDAPEDLPLVLETLYHNLFSDGETLVVELK